VPSRISNYIQNKYTIADIITKLDIHSYNTTYQTILVVLNVFQKV